jgi:hypothetical protein
VRPAPEVDALGSFFDADLDMFFVARNPKPELHVLEAKRLRGEVGRQHVRRLGDDRRRREAPLRPSDLENLTRRERHGGVQLLERPSAVDAVNDRRLHVIR